MILDVGSGDSPLKKADVLCDLCRGNIHRGKNVVIDKRPFLFCDVPYLPFRNKVFDFVYCNQVVEHVDAPWKAFEELKRVAFSGFINVPSWLHENVLMGNKIHQWAFFRWKKNLYFQQNNLPPWGPLIWAILLSPTLRKTLYMLTSATGLFRLRYYFGSGKEIMKEIS